MAFKRSGSGSPDKRNGRFLQRLGAENIFSEFQVQTSPVFEVSGCRPFDHVLRIINDGKKCTEWRDRCPRLKRRLKLQRASRWSNRERAEWRQRQGSLRPTPLRLDRRYGKVCLQHESSFSLERLARRLTRRRARAETTPITLRSSFTVSFAINVKSVTWPARPSNQTSEYN
jgi:hypothetical protein